MVTTPNPYTRRVIARYLVMARLGPLLGAPGLCQVRRDRTVKI